MRCLGRLGCLVVLVIAGFIGWITRDNWLPRRLRSTAAASRSTAWQPVTAAGANRTQAALTKLSQPRGPVFQTLSGADVAAYAFRELSRQLPASTDSIRTMVAGDQMSMRANVKLSDLGSSSELGALGMLGDRAPVELTGTLHVVRPGQGEFQISDVKVRGVSIPHGMIATLLRRASQDRGVARPPGIDADALPLPLPAYIGDIRVANGKVTLYKNVR